MTETRRQKENFLNTNNISRKDERTNGSVLRKRKREKETERKQRERSSGNKHWCSDKQTERKV